MPKIKRIPYSTDKRDKNCPYCSYIAIDLVSLKTNPTTRLRIHINQKHKHIRAKRLLKVLQNHKYHNIWNKIIDLEGIKQYGDKYLEWNVDYFPE